MAEGGPSNMLRHFNFLSNAAVSFFAAASFLGLSCFLLTCPAFAATETVLHNFTGNPDGAHPIAGMVFDSAGNLYGTTSSGGGGLAGDIFELSPNGSGGWNYSVLYSFTDCTLACYPHGALTLDEAGNLYGAAQDGGANNNGTIFQLAQLDGSWSLNVLYSFGPNNSGDGSNPNGVVYFKGALYGTTSYGGKQNGGTVFSVTPNSDGGWSEAVLHSFAENDVDGNNPMGGVTLDAKGNIYGMTSEGGPNQAGTVFELVKSQGGAWKERILHSFSVTDGDMPWYGSLIFDRKGNLYGTTSVGGSGSYGTVFELAPGTNGWTENVLHNFSGGEDGASPDAGVVMDSMGRLYGTTIEGGGRGDCYESPGDTNLFCGTVFLLTPSSSESSAGSSSGSWSISYLHRFTDGADGGEPTAPVVLDQRGNIYGVASQGGSDGVVFELSHVARE
jgi:uncharacterized repeat protein (TIGR03803 family)